MVRILIMVLLFMSMSSLIYAADPCQVDVVYDETDEEFYEHTFYGTEQDKGVLTKMWDWLVNKVQSAMSGIIGVLVSAFPEGLQEDFSLLLPWFRIINTWIPLDLAFQLLFSYWSFLATFVGVKYVVKLFIPAVG